MIRLILVDTDPLIREGMNAALGSEPDMTVIGAVGTGEDAIHLAATTRFDVAIVDATRLPVLTGVET